MLNPEAPPDNEYEESLSISAIKKKRSAPKNKMQQPHSVTDFMPMNAIAGFTDFETQITPPSNTIPRQSETRHHKRRSFAFH